MEPIKPVKNYINWNFDNSYSKLPEAFKEIIKPVSVLNPELVILNENLAKELGLDFSKIEKMNYLLYLQEIFCLKELAQ